MLDAVRSILMLALTVGFAHAQDLDESLPTDPALRIRRLSNGITLYIRQNRVPSGMADLRLVVDAGSVQESNGQEGAAHFVQHMAFRGTTSFSGSGVIDFLTSIGMEFGPDFSALASYDETFYQIEVPTANPIQLAQAVRLLADWASEMTIASADVQAERGRVVQEWTGRSTV